MAISMYLRLVDYTKGALLSNGNYDSNVVLLRETFDNKGAQFINISSYSSDIEQTLNIGSQSTGVGAGKITFNPLTITKYIDPLTPILFQNAASGTPFKVVEICFVNAQNFIQVRHTYKMAAVKTVSWATSADSDSMSEIITFEYGGLFLTVNQQGPDGRLANVYQSGWNRVRNVKDSDVNSVIGVTQ